MSTVHLYRADMQPATRFKDSVLSGEGETVRFATRHLFRCKRCRRLRWASKLRVQVYYDGWYFWCRNENCKRVTGRAKARTR